ncbi:phosphonate metabolism protein/1,5-bisphosphokinase (PRPP-forming) PhnN [Brucella gallinifaecis]|uniref:Ribose 1,5-bisphosphate phosphokinase PhnN n=1 Tax=Brucella gallinifaecis TaxID=215590 RepID=A0A502BQ06_9HYPH|nr:phosphonate metabolism protein/1,5-bisphosphokinase (PRPP-forming) PhnN [Brucella gallinifaecis]TPF75869.1 phosphonate metabolism protein/1,5-bisphosphokinase (PRPP-forming) PhnN [Brucella gallinifaecis]
MQVCSGEQGCFVAVVGPSGAGKDTIINAARGALKNNPRFHFVRRVITREGMPGNEDHDVLDAASFQKAAYEGAYSLHWQAHGLRYGLPCSMDTRLAEGAIVVANVSRQVLVDIRRQYQSYLVVLITAQPSILVERLSSRGRETRQQIEKRLAREVRLDDPAGNIVTIDNSGDIDSATGLFVDHLIKISSKSAY